MHISRQISLTVFLLAISLSIIGQQSIIDSLKSNLQKQSSVTQKARLNIKIAREYISLDTLKAKEYLQAGFENANTADDDMGRGMYHLYKAYLLCNKGLFDEGLNEFNESSVLMNNFLTGKGITKSDKQEADAYLLDAELSRGNVYLELYEYEKAVDMFWNVLKLLESTNIPDKNIALGATYSSIALAYYHREQYQTALGYYLNAVDYSEKGNNEMSAAESNIYAAMCYTLLKKYDSSSFILNKTEPNVLKINNPGLNTNYFARKAELLRFTEQWKDANDNYDKAIQNAKKTGNVYMQATFTHAKARCLLKLNKLNDARIVALEALSLSKFINKKREILESQKVLSLVEAAAGNFTLAYKYLEDYNKGNDSLHTAQITEKIQALDKKYQSELKEERISQLEKDKEIQELATRKKQLINYFLGVGILVLLLIVFMGYRNYWQKQKLQKQRILELENEKQLAATEAVLKGEEQERTRLAKDLHDGLGGMLSGIKYSLNTMKGNLIMTPDNAQAFERSIDMLDSSIREMRRVAHNMMPEALVKFGLDTALKDFCNDINQSGALQVKYQSIGMENVAIEQTTAITIYRIVQELINNTMKHAAANTAIVQISKEGKEITITVEDDGKGFNPVILKGERGIGWRNIQSRIEYLKGKLDVQSEPGKGTSVHIELTA